MVSTALSLPPPKTNRNYPAKQIWSQFCWCLPANFVQVTCTSPSPEFFFLETPVGWSPQTWGLFVKHTKTGGDHGSIDEHSGLSYPQVISYQKDPKGSFIKIHIALERDEGEFFIIFSRFALDGTSWFSYSILWLKGPDSFFLSSLVSGNPLVDSVAEHQPANPKIYAPPLQLMIFVVSSSKSKWGNRCFYFFKQVMASPSLFSIIHPVFGENGLIWLIWNGGGSSDKASRHQLLGPSHRGENLRFQPLVDSGGKNIRDRDRHQNEWCYLIVVPKKKVWWFLCFLGNIVDVFKAFHWGEKSFDQSDMPVFFIYF